MNHTDRVTKVLDSDLPPERGKLTPPGSQEFEQALSVQPQKCDTSLHRKRVYVFKKCRFRLEGILKTSPDRNRIWF
jgi:hypothetical protein